jgi:hypothetical protein
MRDTIETTNGWMVHYCHRKATSATYNSSNVTDFVPRIMQMTCFDGSTQWCCLIDPTSTANLGGS